MLVVLEVVDAENQLYFFSMQMISSNIFAIRWFCNYWLNTVQCHSYAGHGQCFRYALVFFIDILVQQQGLFIYMVKH